MGLICMKRVKSPITCKTCCKHKTNIAITFKALRDFSFEQHKKIKAEETRLEALSTIVYEQVKRILDYGAAPYTYIDDMKEFIDKVTLLNRAS